LTEKEKLRTITILNKMCFIVPSPDWICRQRFSG
jgi:hypothetical protein